MPAASSASIGRGPVVPGFVLAFLALVLLRTAATPPQAVLDAATLGSSLLLAAGLCALGLQIRPRVLLAGGARPLVLALAATATASIVALALVLALAAVGGA